jgi:hypothetical protein
VINFFNRNQSDVIKNLPFFIDLAKKTNKEVFFYDSLLYAISANPNVTKEQFLEFFSGIQDGNIPDFYRYRLFKYIKRSSPEKEKLEWIWGIAKTVDLSKSTYPLLEAGRYILQNLDEQDDLRTEVTECFIRLKGRTVFSESRQQVWPVAAYLTLVETLAESEQDMSKFDEYADMYDKARFRYGDSDNKWMLYSKLARNPHLDDIRTNMIFNNVRKIPDELERAIVMQELLSQSHISGELFDEMFEYRKEIKFVTLWNKFYIGAANNTTHIERVFKFLQNYVKTFSPASERHLVFSGMARNPSVSLEQTDKLISILEKQTLTNAILKGGLMAPEMFQACSGLLSRQGLGNDRIKKILTIFFDYLDEHNNSERGHEGVHDWMSRKFDLSRFEMDDEIFSFYIRRACKNVHKHFLLAQLLPNVHLTGRQFREIVKVLDHAYLKKGTFEGTGTSSSQRYAEKCLLYFWVSNKYVNNNIT